MSPSLKRHSLRTMSSSSPNPNVLLKAKPLFKKLNKVPYVIEIDQRAGQIRVLSALREVVSLTSIGRQMDVKAKNNYRLLGPYQLAVYLAAYESGILGKLLRIDSE